MRACQGPDLLLFRNKSKKEKVHLRTNKPINPSYLETRFKFLKESNANNWDQFNK